jgi:hypothetical protein
MQLSLAECRDKKNFFEQVPKLTEAVTVQEGIAQGACQRPTSTLILLAVVEQRNRLAVQVR